MIEQSTSQISFTGRGLKDQSRLKHSHEIMVDNLIAEMIFKLKEEIEQEEEWNRRFNLHRKDKAPLVDRSKKLDKLLEEHYYNNDKSEPEQLSKSRSEK